MKYLIRFLKIILVILFTIIWLLWLPVFITYIGLSPITLVVCYVITGDVQDAKAMWENSIDNMGNWITNCYSDIVEEILHESKKF